jgi:hypothetical protein
VLGLGLGSPSGPECSPYAWQGERKELLRAGLITGMGERVARSAWVTDFAARTDAKCLVSQVRHFIQCRRSIRLSAVLRRNGRSRAQTLLTLPHPDFKVLFTPPRRFRVKALRVIWILGFVFPRCQAIS